MDHGSVLRTSARAAIAVVEVALRQFLAAAREARESADDSRNLAALVHARAGDRSATDHRADALLAGAVPLDAVDLGVGRAGQRTFQRSFSLIVGCTNLRRSKCAQCKEPQDCRLSHHPSPLRVMRSVIRFRRRAGCRLRKLVNGSALRAALPDYGSLSQQQCTVAELTRRARTHSAEAADVQRYCTTARRQYRSSTGTGALHGAIQLFDRGRAA